MNGVEPETPRSVESAIASSGKAPPWVEVAPDVIFTPAFMEALDELLERREQRASVHAARPTRSVWGKRNLDRNLNRRCPTPRERRYTVNMDENGFSSVSMTREEIEEFFALIVK